MGVRHGVARRGRFVVWAAFPVTIGATAAALALLAVALLADGAMLIGVLGRDVRLTLETAMAVVAVVVAFLVWGRFVHRRARSDLLIATALTVMALSHVSAWLLPVEVLPDLLGPRAWHQGFLRAATAVLLVQAAWTSDTPVRGTALRDIWYVPAALLSIAALIAVAGASGWLPPPVRGGPDAGVLHWALRSLEFGGAVLAALAAVGFARGTLERDDEFRDWLAGATILAVGSRISTAFVPSLYTPDAHLAEVFRLGVVLLVAVGVAREVRESWDRLAEARVREERRRLARDVHDGIAQELVYLSTEVRLLQHDLPEEQVLTRLSAAVDRAVDESRFLIVSRSTVEDASFGELLDAVVRELATRGGAQSQTEVDPALEMSPVVAETLLRVTREAVSNAVHHGKAAAIRVGLREQDGLRLTIADDGIGFDPSCPAGDGFGLTSMRERVTALGGVLHVGSAPGCGTNVEVVL